MPKFPKEQEFNMEYLKVCRKCAYVDKNFYEWPCSNCDPYHSKFKEKGGDDGRENK